VRADVAIALGMFGPTAGLSAVYSSRVAMAWTVALTVVGPIELAGAKLDANHPLRIALPFVLGALSYSEMVRQGRLSKAYVMALLTFALSGVAVAALFFHALGGAWIVPGFTVLVCTLICIVALIPKGRIPWLLS
jgi:hypothetical protein